MPCRKRSTPQRPASRCRPALFWCWSIYNNNVLTDYFVMEKGVDWGLDFPEEVRTGDWHFQQFDPDQASETHRRSPIAACRATEGRRSNDFMFTIDRMRAYMP